MKPYILLLFCLHLFAANSQVVAPDSTIEPVELTEVVVCSDNKDMNSESFNFHKGSKVSGTEEIMSRIEGINLIRRGAFGTEPVIRNYAAGQINLYINGMRMYGACTDKMDPVSSYIEPPNLGSFQVNMGAGNSMGNALGGSVNFKLKEAAFHCHRKTLAQIYTSFNTVNKAFVYGSYVNWNKEKWANRVSFIYRKAQNYIAGKGIEVNHSQYEKFNISSNSIYKLNSKSVLLLDVIYDRGNHIGYPALPMDVAKAEAFISSITLRKTNRHKHLSETKIYHNRVNHFMDDTRRNETIIHMDMPGWTRTVGFYSNYMIKSPKHLVDFRVDGHHVSGKAEMTMYPVGALPMYMQTLPGNVLNNVGYSVRYQYKAPKNFLLSALVRNDYFNQKGTDSIGILQWGGMGYHIVDTKQNFLYNASFSVQKEMNHFNTEFVLANGNRLPSSNERYGLYLFNRADGFDYIGNPNLKPESAFQMEWRNQYKNKKIQLYSTVFMHRIYQYIYAYYLYNYSPMTFGANGVKTYSNIAGAKLYGVELNVKYAPMKLLTFHGNLRYVRGTLSNGLPMQQTPPFKAIVVCKYQFRKLQFQGEWIGASPQILINSDFREVSTPGWNIYNFRLSENLMIKQKVVQLFFAVENITNRYYREHLDWGKIPQPGRNFSFGLNVYFD